ncbi:hypothetical protein [Nocardioides bigeumensis]|uniref:hypothetical protein n=1 Tax=Nocardioides bigeumensis TaxID=433657 RepID=UPI0031DBDA1A
MARENVALIKDAKVLEIGSYDVNGSVRRTFAAASEHVGVDLVEGPGVDRIGFGHEVVDATGTYDITLSTECFEHDPHWRETFANMVRLTRPGGLVTFTCASRGRPEHGTQRTQPSMSPGTQFVGSDYYQNLTERDFSGFPLDDWFTASRFWYVPTSFDLYFAGVRAGGPDGAVAARLPDGSSVAAIGRIMPRGHRLVRWPLRLALRGESETAYQNRILGYWKFVLRSGGLAAGIAPRIFRRDKSR